jgi:phage/plasmid-like protein (TIGR03299 family)
MSRETLTHLNTNVLVGFTAKRGLAWHYKADEQGSEPNHYPGAIPVEDVRRRLLNWQAVEAALYAQTGDLADINPIDMLAMNSQAEMAKYVLGKLGMRHQPDRKAISRSDDESVMGVFKDGYQPHQYDQWLLETVANILDDTLSIGSAGLLKGGAVAWVQVEVPDNCSVQAGDVPVEFRPNLLATTSFDGSIATTFKRTATIVVCDNTREIALGEKGQRFKAKHSRNSGFKLLEAREALGVLHSATDDFAAEVTALAATRVSAAQFNAFVDALVLTDTSGKVRTWAELRDKKSTASLTMAENKRDALMRLWNHDERVAPWRGNAWGVAQMVNTFNHHEGTVRGSSRPERNMLNAVTGKTGTADAEAMTLLGKVLANA